MGQYSESKFQSSIARTKSKHVEKLSFSNSMIHVRKFWLKQSIQMKLKIIYSKTDDIYLSFAFVTSMFRDQEPIREVIFSTASLVSFTIYMKQTLW